MTKKKIRLRAFLVLNRSSAGGEDDYPADEDADGGEGGDDDADAGDAGYADGDDGDGMIVMLVVMVVMVMMMMVMIILTLMTMMETTLLALMNRKVMTVALQRLQYGGG